MKDKSKEIEELAKKLRAYAYDLRLNDNDDCRRVAEFIVETLNYQKMDKVTLRIDLGDMPAEEISELVKKFPTKDTAILQVKNDDDGLRLSLESEKEKIKKQVAQEVLQDLINFYDGNNEEGFADYEVQNELKMFAEKYGVEIKQ